MSHKDVSIMFSGGLDSFIAYHYAMKNQFIPTPIYVDMGHPYSEEEQKSIRNMPFDVTVLPFRNLYPQIQKRLENQIIPSRNVMLAVIGSMFAHRVWLGALEGEQNGKEHDKSYRFFRDISTLLSFTNEFFQAETIVETPFSHMTKADTIAWALNNGIPEKDLISTNSCYFNDGSGPCGKCLTCYKRHVAFYLNGIVQKNYQNGNNPLESDYAREIDNEISIAIENGDRSRFTESRIEEHLKLKEKLGK